MRTHPSRRPMQALLAAASLAFLPLAGCGGGGFVFRTDAPAAYTRVDRMGEPAVATALVRAPQKTAFNDDSPVQDATGKWVPEFAGDLTDLTNALKDDFASLNLKMCASGT